MGPELSESPSLAVMAAERERRRIERDLHDGAQQRLVALRIELQLVEELVQRDPAAGVDRLRELGGAVEEALRELRSLARGDAPRPLTERGLVEALRAIARRSPLAVDVEARGVGRYEPEVERAVYFCVAEALQNALKHAAGVRRVAVCLQECPGGELRFSVRDDGGGMAAGGGSGGTGLANMAERLQAVGGELRILSVAGGGTAVHGAVPVRLGAAA